MRKMRAEIPSKLQQNHLGMESNASSPLDVAARIGAEGRIAAADSPRRRAVSFLGPAASAKFSDAVASRLVAGSSKFSGGPVGLGKGRRIGEAPACSGDGEGERRGGVTGVVSGFWGSALRTLSFGGSAISNQVAPKKIAENPVIVTR
jgi:hypothetical protein